MKQGSLTDLVAVVCGGSGMIGGGVAEVLARRGATVAVQYRGNRSRAEQVASAVRANGGRAECYRCDAVSEVSVRSFYEAVATAYGGIDILVNAIHQAAPMKELGAMTWTDWSPHLDAIRAHFNLCQQALPHLRESGNGRVVYISGGLSKRFYPGNTAYSMAKSGLNSFCKTLALEEAQYGTTVNIVAPGRVEPDGPSSATWKDIDDAWEYVTPLKRKVGPKDVGEAVAYFVDPASACITGQTLFVAGGEIIP